jgi:hypothetical protein
MSPKQLREFFKLYQKEIFKYWLNVVPVREQFDKWISEEPTDKAMVSIASHALVLWVEAIVENEYLEYSKDEGSKPCSDAFEARLQQLIEKEKD